MKKVSGLFVLVSVGIFLVGLACVGLNLNIGNVFF